MLLMTSFAVLQFMAVVRFFQEASGSLGRALYVAEPDCMITALNGTGFGGCVIRASMLSAPASSPKRVT
jgi:hypothetical protein